MAELTPAEELLRRRGARETLAGWMQFRDSPNVPALHHRLLIAELEKVERGETKNLMFNLPPGSAKSTYGSTEFPAWYMGRNPEKLIIGAANTDELAEVFSRRVRNIVDTQEFANVFGFGLSDDKKGVGNWVNSKNGEYFAAGVGAAIAGRRGDIGIIDDPVKSRVHADSESSRNAVWEWYVNDFLTRLKPGAPQVIIMTRWHEADLGGRILERDSARWRVVSIPMEAETDDPLGRKFGERLWPEYFTDEMVALAKQDRRSWSALYQQKPSPDEGNYFKANWFGEYDRLPPNLTYYGASDYAVTDGSGDLTEHGVFGVDHNANIYVVDWWRGQTSPDVWIERLCDLILKYKPMTWFGESGVIRRSIEPFMMRRMQERNAYCKVDWMASIANKEIRARGIQARASMGKVWFPKHAPWKTDVLSQLLMFPAGKHDDAVDVVSLIGRGLEVMVSAGAPANEARYYRAGSWLS